MANTAVNVLDYGANGNGAFDNTAAFQAAINAAAAAGGVGEVYIPGGNYRVTGTLNLNGQYVKITGAGRQVAVIQHEPSVARALFNITRTDLQRAINHFAHFGVETNTQGLSTAFRVQTTLVAGVNVLGSYDSLSTEYVRVSGIGAGWFRNYMHAINTGGTRHLYPQYENTNAASQNDQNNIAFLLEANSVNAYVVRALTLYDPYILRVYDAIRVICPSPRQIESLRITVGEIVGVNGAVIRVSPGSSLGAFHIEGTHIAFNNVVIDSRGGRLLIGTITGADIRKEDNGGPATGAPFFLFSYAERIAVVGNTFMSHASQPQVSVFQPDTQVDGVSLLRAAVTGNSFTGFNRTIWESVVGMSRCAAGGNSYSGEVPLVYNASATAVKGAIRDADAHKVFSLVQSVAPNGFFDVQLANEGPLFANSAPLSVQVTFGSDVAVGSMALYHFDGSTKDFARVFFRGNPQFTARLSIAID